MLQSALHLLNTLAVVVDGNGRCADQRGAADSTGHVAGARALRTIVSHCATIGVPQLTLYAFSSDNCWRPTKELQGLPMRFTSHVRSQASVLARHGIRRTVIGRRDRLPRTLETVIPITATATAHGRRMHLRIAIDYSSRAAITPSHVDAGTSNAFLRPVDLMIRAGGERRLPDFLSWDGVYANLVFLNVLWPDMTPEALDDACRDFAQRDRRFGGLTQRVSA